jgi:pimeloyl-ACP methyl ester carboxylesterase
MTPFTRRLGLTITAAALVLAAAPAYAGATATSMPTSIAWQPCPEDATVECGTLRLPVDWARPGDEKFDLAIARRRATDPSRRVGPLIINPGGPGGSGVDFALVANQYFSPDVLARFDIVGFDPRGVARSNPVRCSQGAVAATPSAAPRNQKDFDRLVASNRALGADCRRHTGPLIDHVDTLSVVRDIDAIRTALGESKISYYGVSYGTLIGQEYAEQFGQHIRAMVIDSNMDHSLEARRFLVTQAATVEDSFDEFVAWCARDSRCALHGQDVPTIWDRLLAKAGRGELTDPDHPNDGPITADQVINTAFLHFYGPDWPTLAGWLAALEAESSAPSAARKAVQDGTEELVNYPIAVFCEDWRIGIPDYPHFARYASEERGVAPHMRHSPAAEGAALSCLGWPSKVADPQHRLRVRNAPTILMLDALHDPATGYNWATNAHRQLGSAAVLLTYDGWGHGVYRQGPCPAMVTDSYLTYGILPKQGSHCPAVPPAGTALTSSQRPLPAAGPRPGDLPGWSG